MPHFRAFRIHNDDTGYRAGIETMETGALSPGEVLVKVAYSSVNYKDALAGTGKGRILRTYPLNGGIDVAGHVVASTDPALREGDAVLCTGSGLSETRDGGYGEYARLDARWTIPLPAGLSLRESMIIGTAGFTAALALLRMQDNRQSPALGPIAVTGASGGVGMLAIDIFSRAGYEVHAISGKADHFDFLRELGASECIDRHQLAFSGKPMDSARFGGALDNVGGGMLGGLLPLIAPYGNVAICGNAGGIAFDSTVMPFIIRGASLLGIASAGTARDLRDAVWQHLANDWKPQHLERIVTRETSLDELPDVFARMLAGDSFGRTLVRIEGTV
ncbi:YhdH/YhfP family quinone oxidoreductase [Rhodanobacter sp. KK11]|uniref:YhdH/YhfP family quinone oxidoreductase n=1 Tax=Rhodanobacter sp. KK11 TaxID=3083255 RepID=UPI0029669DD0|nr:YhdH/YhfP family quinone oxidoreductase [Rhodanobacter sp. KK11]MDW2981151.1 YhdH/YhfP family quinone oxidoreductase [Rhodanobacter sp. KK11]